MQRKSIPPQSLLRQALVQGLVDLFLETPQGKVVSFSTMSDRISENVLDRRDLISSADRRLQRYHKLALISVHGEGYRTAFAHEHVHLAMKYLDASIKDLQRGIHVNASADENKLTPLERERKQEMGTHLQREKRNKISSKKNIQRRMRFYDLAIKRESGAEMEDKETQELDKTLHHRDMRPM